MLWAQPPGSSSDFTGLDFVHITPDPRLPRLIGTDQRVLSLVEMFGRVLVLRRVSTTHMSAREAEAQMNPRIAGLHAVFAHMFVRFFDLDLVQVRTFFRHRSLRESIWISSQVTRVI